VFRRYENIVGRELYDHYRATRSKVAKGANQYNLFSKAVIGMMSDIVDLILENDNGLYLEDFGYFTFEKNGTVVKRRVSILKKEEIEYNSLRFEFLDEELNEKYVFSTPTDKLAKSKKNKNYAYKKDAIEHQLKNSKRRW